MPEELLRLLLAYHVQEEALGGLDEAVAHELDLAAQSNGAQLGKDVSGSQSVPQPAEPAHGKGARKGSQAVPASPAIGTRLIREWNGRTIRVDVREEGFVWNGAVYASLSAIARAVTGARWSGPRFFALDGGRRRG